MVIFHSYVKLPEGISNPGNTIRHLLGDAAILAILRRNDTIWFVLLGGWPTPLKNMSSSNGIIVPQYMEKIK